MKTLALETSGRQGSLCAWQVAGNDPGQAIHEIQLPADERSAKTLAPCLKRLLADAGWRAQEIDAVAVASGPGSFTGLRVGVTAAKMLAYVAGCGVVEVGTLRVLAAQAGFGAGPVWAAIDAQRGEVFAARYEHADDDPEVQLLPFKTFASVLQPGEVVTGAVCQKIELPAGVTLAPATAWQPQSRTVAQLAAPAALAGRLINPEQLVPRYHRLSAAEEKRLRG